MKEEHMKKLMIILTMMTLVFVSCGEESTTQLESNTTDIATTEIHTTNITTTEKLSPTEYYIDIEMGYVHSVALTNLGRVFTWGLNEYGQLSGDLYEYSDEPLDITYKFDLNENEYIIDVDCGHYHTMALTSENRLFVWGDNNYGQIPGYRYQMTINPQEVSGYLLLEPEEKIITIDSGAGFSGILTSNHRLIMWGYNGAGELGFMSGNMIIDPIDVTNYMSLLEGEYISEFEIGYRHSSILTSEGRILLWGDNTAGQIGNNLQTNVQYSPADITSFIQDNDEHEIAFIILGYWFSSAITTSGELYMWGSNLHGEIGFDNESIDRQLKPINVTEFFELEEGDFIENVYHGGLHSFAVTHFGYIYAWGQSSYGKLADTFLHDVFKPVDVTESFDLEDGEDIQLFNLGNWTSSILTSNGRLFVWGANQDGRLGLGNTMNYRYPVELLMPERSND
jgi:alpha-tubulin suppressor-like RCC1 family protein